MQTYRNMLQKVRFSLELRLRACVFLSTESSWFSSCADFFRVEHGFTDYFASPQSFDAAVLTASSLKSGSSDGTFSVCDQSRNSEEKFSREIQSRNSLSLLENKLKIFRRNSQLQHDCINGRSHEEDLDEAEALRIPLFRKPPTAQQCRLKKNGIPELYKN